MSHVESGHGFHAGEVAVQQRAGVQAAAERLEGMLGPARLSAGVTRFLTERTFAALTARAADGRLWSVPLLGDPGFLDVVDSTSIRIDAVPQRSGPLHPLALPQAAGLIVIDYSRRRRFRLNGTLVPTPTPTTISSCRSPRRSATVLSSSRNALSTRAPWTPASPRGAALALTRGVTKS